LATGSYRQPWGRTLSRPSTGWTQSCRSGCWGSSSKTLVPLALLPPEEGLPAPAQPSVAALPDPVWMSSWASHPLPLLGVLAATAWLLLPSPRSPWSPRRSRGRLCPGPPLLAGAGTTPLGGHGNPQRGGPAGLRALQPQRGQHGVSDPGGCLRGWPQQDWPIRWVLCRPSRAPSPPPRSNYPNKRSA